MLTSEASTEPVVIRADRLEVAYGDKRVWRDATFDVRRGEFVAVIGPNGAGKTTLFRMLLGLQRPRSGSLTIFGGRPRRGSPRIGYVPQRHNIDSETHIECENLVRMGASQSRWGPGFASEDGGDRSVPTLRSVTGGSPRLFLGVAAVGVAGLALTFTGLARGTVPPLGSMILARFVPWAALGLMVGLTAFGLARSRARAGARIGQAASQALAAVGASDLAHKRLGSLSGGELQRVFLAEAMVGNPEMLLLDEPLSNLDLRRGRELVDLVDRLVRSRNVTTLLVAHDINPLIQCLDKVIYIANGKVATGAPEVVLTSETLSRLYEVPVEVLRDSRGNLVIVGTEEAQGGEAG